MVAYNVSTSVLYICANTAFHICRKVNTENQATPYIVEEQMTAQKI